MSWQEGQIARTADMPHTPSCVPDIEQHSRACRTKALAACHSLFSSYVAGRFVKGLMQKAGMSIREDAMGNIWARWKGADTDAGES